MPASARSFRLPSQGRVTELTNQERLRAYDLAAAADERPDFAQQRMDLAERRQAFDEAQKQASVQAREQQLQTQNEFNERKMEAMEAESKARESLQNLNLDTQTKMFQETASAAKALQDIDPAKADARARVLQVIADHPYGSLHPEIKQFSESILESAKANQAAQQKLAQVDPLKMAQQIRGQIGTYEKQAEGLDKSIADMELTNPNFSKTTGIFTDKDGQRKFGLPGTVGLLGGVTQPVASTKDEAMFNAYQAAIKQRADLQARIPQLNSQLDNVLNGNLAAVTPPGQSMQPTATPQSQPSSALPPGFTPVPDQATEPVPPSVGQAAASAAQATGAPPPVAQQVAQSSVQPTQPAPVTTPQPPAPDIHQLAFAAIQRNPQNRDAIVRRLQTLGGDPTKLQQLEAAQQQQAAPAPVATAPAPVATQ